MSTEPVCYNDEFDLQKSITVCKKNPGHKNFTPIKQFSLDIIPYEYGFYKSQELCDTIKLLSNLVVLIKNPHISKHRPADDTRWRDNEAGRNNLRGTGWLANVSKWKWHDTTERTFSVGDMQGGELGGYGEFRIRTAKHVIFDSSEAEQTVAELFHDDSNDKDRIKTLQGSEVVESDDIGDTCEFIFITNDRDLWNALYYIGWECYQLKKIQRKKDTTPDLVVIISHPHGSEKQISFGETKERKPIKNIGDTHEVTTYVYTAPTCPGSSGAPVFVVDRASLSVSFAPHSGRMENNNNNNFSGYGMEMSETSPFLSTVSKMISHEHAIARGAQSSHTDAVQNLNQNKENKPDMKIPCTLVMTTGAVGLPTFIKPLLEPTQLLNNADHILPANISDAKVPTERTVQNPFLEILSRDSKADITSPRIKLGIGGTDMKLPCTLVMTTGAVGLPNFIKPLLEPTQLLNNADHILPANISDAKVPTEMTVQNPFLEILSRDSKADITSPRIKLGIGGTDMKIPCTLVMTTGAVGLPNFIKPLLEPTQLLNNADHILPANISDAKVPTEMTVQNPFLEILSRDSKADITSPRIKVGIGGTALPDRLLRPLCYKHPGHEDFTPRTYFSLRHLPPDYRHPSVLDAIMIVADSTVKISTSYTSKDRPANQGFLHLAGRSGFLYDFDKSSGFLHGGCPCTECRESKNPKKQFAKFCVLVSNHSVFDNLEAQYTTCELFYNDDMQNDCVEKLYGSRIIHSDPMSDICFLEVVTHDIDLSKRLIEMLNRRAFLLHKCSEVINVINSFLPLNPIAVIVSHPHGCCQTITTGRVWYDKHAENLPPDSAGCTLQIYGWDTFKYETPTCTGPSGALVFLLKAGQKNFPLTINSIHFGDHVIGNTHFLKTNFH